MRHLAPKSTIPVHHHSYRFIPFYTGFLGGVAEPHPADRAETGARLCSYGMTMGRGPNPVKIPIHDV
jgi:hypothetical protein